METCSRHVCRVVSLISACMQTMDGAHWPHMEFPDVFNAIMDEWLAGVGLKGELSKMARPQSEEDKGKHLVIDEL